MSGLRITDHMEGFVSFDERTDYNAAWAAGKEAGSECSFDLRIEADDIDRFLREPDHEARVAGTLRCEQLAPGDLELEAGSTWNMLVDTSADGRRKRMYYRLLATTPDGAPITLSGFKEVADDPNYDIWTDTSTLFVRVISGHVTAQDEDDAAAIAPKVIAAGILRISHLGFGKLLASIRGTGGPPWRRAIAVAKFQKAFVGGLAQVYAGRRLEGDDPDFPRWAPDPEALGGRSPGEWHDLAERPGLRRRIVPFTAADGFRGNMHNIRGADEPTRSPVLLLHGTGVRANVFYGAPSRHSIVDSLVAEGYDVWAANWRGSIDFAPQNYTLDEAAAYDHPAAIAEIRRQTGAETLKAIVHCQGSTSFMISHVAGLVPEVTTVVSSAVSLHPRVTRGARIKQRILLPAAALSTPYIDAQWGIRAPSAMAKGLARWARLLRRECDDPVCALANYMFGAGPEVLWLHANLDEATHAWTAREFGYAPFRFLRQLSKSVRAGHLVPVDGIPTLPESYVAAPPPHDARFTFVAGTANRLFLPESQERTFAYFEGLRPGVHALHLFPGYGHLDVFLGRNAEQDTYPAILAGLAD
jgi:hypothetical protein